MYDMYERAVHSAGYTYICIHTPSASQEIVIVVLCCINSG